MNEKYNVDDLFKKQEIKNTILENNTTNKIEDTQALISKEEKWYTIVLNKIKEFLASLKK